MSQNLEKEKFSFEEDTQKLITFLNDSPSCFHAVENLTRECRENGYTELSEKESWSLKKGGKYFVTRNHSSLIAFQIPELDCKGFHIMASHSDSPTFKIKVNPEMLVEGHYLKLNTEGYGGMIMSTWLDRPLSFAGRVFVKDATTEEGFVEKLVAPDENLLIIPNMAIHMNREINSGYSYNAQVDMLPLFSEQQEEHAFLQYIAKVAEVEAEDILGYDLFLVNQQKAELIGLNKEFVGGGRLDDLQSVFGTKEGFLLAEPKNSIAVLAVFDNEEVGSGTRQGADSTFLQDVLEDIAAGLGRDAHGYRMMVANSFLMSVDNAHAVHPNHTEKADPTNRPYLNAGIVLKYHGGQKYTTDGYTGAVVKTICDQVNVPMQTFTNRSDAAGGSTLGNISTAHVSVDSADIGLPQLAMHSSYELAGVKDTSYLIAFSKAFYEK